MAGGVRSSQIKDETIESVDIKDNSINSEDIGDGEIKRDDVNTIETGQSLIRRLFSAFGINIDTSTGADSGTGDVTISLAPHSHVLEHKLSGRFEIDSDSDWACWSDLSFGPSLQDWDLDLADSGPGGIPVEDWDAMGLGFVAGSVLKQIIVKVRGNNNDIDSVQSYVRMHDVDMEAGDAIDSNGEIGAIEVDGIRTFNLDGGPVAGNDVQVIRIPLNNYVVQNDAADMHLMFKAVNGSLTGNRQLRCQIIVEYCRPNNLENIS